MMGINLVIYRGLAYQFVYRAEDRWSADDIGNSSWRQSSKGGWSRLENTPSQREG